VLSGLKQLTKAFHHFFQKLGTLSVFAFVVVIAFQVLVAYVRAGRRTPEDFAPPAQSSKANRQPHGCRSFQLTIPTKKMFKAVSLKRGRLLIPCPERAWSARSEAEGINRP
jgi:hypothetical protein